MKKIFTFVCALISMSCIYAANDGKINYNGDNFKVSVFNKEVAEKEIASAKAVYAFELVDFDLDLGNTFDNCEVYHNPKTNEYAVGNSVKVDGEWKEYAIIFSLGKAEIMWFQLSGENDNPLKHLPSGFDYADPYKVGFAGYSSEAGYCNASHNGKHNSMIVFIK